MLRLQAGSASAERKSNIKSGASGIKLSACLYIYKWIWGSVNICETHKIDVNITYTIDAQHSVASHVRMTMFQIGTHLRQNKTPTINQSINTTYNHFVQHRLLTAGINGSNNSASRMLHKKRHAEPRMYSFGCLKSFRTALLSFNQNKNKKINRLNV